jgi:branched-chain amino acid transport system permease protein
MTRERSLTFVLLAALLALPFAAQALGHPFYTTLATRMAILALAAVGIEPFPIRLVAFVLSAVITAVAGAMFAELNRFASPSMLAWPMSGELIVLIILGGTGRLAGPVAGAMLYVMLEYWLGGFTERWQLFLGLMLLAVVLFARGGVVGLVAGKPGNG